VILKNYLKELDAKDREVIILVDIAGYSYDEAAQLTETTESAVRSRLHRARKTFSEIYFETNDATNTYNK